MQRFLHKERQEQTTMQQLRINVTMQVQNLYTFPVLTWLKWVWLPIF